MMKKGMGIQGLLLCTAPLKAPTGDWGVANIIIPPGIVPPLQGEKVTIYECCSVMLIAVNRFGELIFCTQPSASVACAVWEHRSHQSTNANKSGDLLLPISHSWPQHYFWQHKCMRNMTLACFLPSRYAQEATFEGTL